MKVFHCPNRKCQKIVFKNHNQYLPSGVDIEMRCFHCGEWVRITTENTIVIKKLILVEDKKRKVTSGFIG